MPNFTGEFLGSQLGQTRPANTTAVSIFSPRDKVIVNITSIIIANLTGSTHNYRLFHDDNGTTYDETTAIAWDIPIIANDSVPLLLNIWMSNKNGNLAVRTDSSNDLTFTVYGTTWYGPIGINN